MTTSTTTRERGRAREGLAAAIGRVPDTARVTAAGARGTTSALQQIPDSKLRWLTASSIGLAAGLKVAGAPRWMQAAGIVPALFTGAAIALRPAQAAPTAAIDLPDPAGLAGARGTGNA
jgi:acyl-CoA reductase-like NAD-dependent aldehyde dehydrogenase